jgi:rare lipoprotein A
VNRALAAVVLLSSCATTVYDEASQTVAAEVDEGCDVTARNRCEDGPCPSPTARALSSFTGRVSYYGDMFIGRRTASGERYDARALTAASRDLPFGTILRVTRRSNGRVVILRVNDRGPSRRGGRVLDLSRKAAECLDMIRAGVTEVRADVIYRPRSS